MTKDENGVLYDPDVKEIAHSIILPPAHPGDAAAPLYGGQVVFMNQRGSLSVPPDDDHPTFLWDPSKPRLVQEHLMVPETIEFDLFCSGHSFLGDGRPFTAGGQNHATQGTVGQSLSYILGTDSVAPQQPPAWTTTVGTLAAERWYPTVVTLPDGRMLTTGATPFCDPLDPTNCGAHQHFGDGAHQVFQPLTENWGTERPNQAYDAMSACPTDPDMTVLHYPRLHVLAGGYVMQVDGKASSGDPSHVSWFLKTDDSVAAADCSAGPEPYNQWQEGDRIPGDTRDASQKGAPSVHFLWPSTGDPTTYEEVVYQFGGHWEPHDDGAGCPTAPDGEHYATNRVARMTDPHPTKYWQEDVVPMPEGRVNHNAVILMDGSVMLVGGEDNPGTGCEYRTTPVIFRPEEFFGVAGGTYQQLATQTSLRRYHSVAGLLPDGRVFSAGGAKEEVPSSSGNYIGDPYTVELFTPPYLFHAPVPTIESTFATPWLYGDPVSFDVHIPNDGEVKRVALVRVGSSTHAFDASQRYVVLPKDDVLDLGGGYWRVQTRVPPNGNVAPPGWYMLVVTTRSDLFPGGGSAKFVPSEGAWIKLE